MERWIESRSRPRNPIKPKPCTELPTMTTFTDYPTLTPYIVVQGAAKAIEFYKAAFGAEERYRLSASGSDAIGHAELTVHGHLIMLADEMKGMNTSPTTLNGTT